MGKRRLDKIQLESKVEKKRKSDKYIIASRIEDLQAYEDVVHHFVRNRDNYLDFKKKIQKLLKDKSTSAIDDIQKKGIIAEKSFSRDIKEFESIFSADTTMSGVDNRKQARIAVIEELCKSDNQVLSDLVKDVLKKRQQAMELVSNMINKVGNDKVRILGGVNWIKRVENYTGSEELREKAKEALNDYAKDLDAFGKKVINEEALDESRYILIEEAENNAALRVVLTELAKNQPSTDKAIGDNTLTMTSANLQEKGIRAVENFITTLDPSDTEKVNTWKSHVEDLKILHTFFKAKEINSETGEMNGFEEGKEISIQTFRESRDRAQAFLSKRKEALYPQTLNSGEKLSVEQEEKRSIDERLLDVIRSHFHRNRTKNLTRLQYMDMEFNDVNNSKSQKADLKANFERARSAIYMLRDATHPDKDKPNFTPWYQGGTDEEGTANIQFPTTRKAAEYLLSNECTELATNIDFFRQIREDWASALRQQRLGFNSESQELQEAKDEDAADINEKDGKLLDQFEIPRNDLANIQRSQVSSEYKKAVTSVREIASFTVKDGKKVRLGNLLEAKAGALKLFDADLSLISKRSAILRAVIQQAKDILEPEKETVKRWRRDVAKKSTVELMNGEGSSNDA